MQAGAGQHGADQHRCRDAQDFCNWIANQATGPQDQIVLPRDRIQGYAKAGTIRHVDVTDKPEDNRDNQDGQQNAAGMGQHYPPVIPAHGPADDHHFIQPARHGREIGCGAIISPYFPEKWIGGQSRNTHKGRQKGQAEKPFPGAICHIW